MTLFCITRRILILPYTAMKKFLQFNNEQYATIPSGVIEGCGRLHGTGCSQRSYNSEQLGMVYWRRQSASGVTGRISDYIFMSANSGQGRLCRERACGGESRK